VPAGVRIQGRESRRIMNVEGKWACWIIWYTMWIDDENMEQIGGCRRWGSEVEDILEG
jgi:hypothetical protein